MGSGGVKLSHTEAAKLLAYLERWARPATPEAQDEHLLWRRRLEGPRS